MRRLFTLMALSATSICGAFDVEGLPKNYADLKQPVTYKQLQEIVEKAQQTPNFTVSIEGNSVEGRPLYLVTASKTETPKWEVMFMGCQHGNEHSGKDAISYMIWNLVENPDQIPDDVAIHFLPNSNPDGSEADRRQNTAKQDLNRDHLFLNHPETQTMHKVAARVRPDLFVDCHEFSRDSGDYTENGWSEWPLIMMDTASNPFLPEPLYKTGLEWVEAAAPEMKSKGYNYCRYFVGGTPPHDEQRHSTLEIDDARNGIATYGGLSFIIEAGIYRAKPEPQADLGERVSAYLTLLNRFVHDQEMINKSLEVLEKSREEKPYSFIPTNYFWGKTTNSVKQFPVVEIATGETKELAVANFMNERVIKNFVPTPTAYIIPAEKAEIYKTLLTRHAIPYTRLDQESSLIVEASILERVETEEDPIYNRYADRQIVTRKNAEPKVFKIGSIRVNLDGEHARRAALVLEPSMLYGLMQDPEFRNQVPEKGEMAVYRLP
jgi:hypothetical protein